MKDLSGQTFGKWTVMRRSENNHKGASMWECRCACGVEAVVNGTNLRLGRTKGCKKCKGYGMSGTKGHGMSGTKVYKAWKNMRNRCFYPKDKSFDDYGARGITVCKEWKDSFQAFYDYVSQLPHFGEEGYSLDRINNDGNYEPGNVKWSTAYEQTHNRRISKNSSKLNKS